MNVLNVGTWYNIRKVIDKATSNDETVTSGFIYNEINQLTNESDYHCQQVLENLIYKLSYDKPIIKRKALLVIKSCIERGNPNFRRDLHHKMEDLRKASNYTGVPDKLEGEAPYKRVREEANKVMNMMYDTRTTKKYSTDNIEGNKPSGLGQDTKVFHEYQDGSTGLNPSSNKIKLESYGNWKPTPQQKSTTEKVLEVGGQLVGGVSNLSSVAYNKVKTVITGKEETKPYEPSYEKSYYVPPSSSNVDFSGTGNIRKLAEGSKWEEHKTRRKKGEVSDSWNVDSSNDSYYDDNNNHTSSSSPKSTPKHSNNGSSNKPKFDYSFQSNFDFINDNQYGGSSSSSSNFSGDSNNSPFDPNAPKQSSNKQQDDQVDEAVEQYCFKLVEEITTPSGLRNHLEPTAINTFLKKAESLNIEVISFCLDAKLEDQNQKTILNALTLIESLLNSNNTAYKYFLDNTRNVENHTESPNQTVKSKATTVLNLILLKQKAKKKKTKKKKSTKNTTNSTNSSSPSPQTNNNNSLLNFLNETNTTPNNNNTNNSNNVTTTNQQNGNFNTNQQGNLLGFLETNTTSNLNVNNNTNTNNSNNNNTNNSNNNNNQFSILDDIKNLNISSNRAPPLNNLLNNYSPNPYPVHSHVQAPVYYNYPYQPPVVSYPSHPHTTLYSSPVTPQPTVSVNDSKNDSAFSFINDEIKKEVK